MFPESDIIFVRKIDSRTTVRNLFKSERMWLITTVRRVGVHGFSLLSAVRVGVLLKYPNKFRNGRQQKPLNAFSEQQ